MPRPTSRGLGADLECATPTPVFYLHTTPPPEHHVRRRIGNGTHATWPSAPLRIFECFVERTKDRPAPPPQPHALTLLSSSRNRAIITLSTSIRRYTCRIHVATYMYLDRAPRLHLLLDDVSALLRHYAGARLWSHLLPSTLRLSSSAEKPVIATYD